MKEITNNLKEILAYVNYCRDMRNNEYFEPIDRLVYMDEPHKVIVELLKETLDLAQKNTLQPKSQG